MYIELNILPPRKFSRWDLTKKILGCRPAVGQKWALYCKVKIFLRRKKIMKIKIFKWQIDISATLTPTPTPATTPATTLATIPNPTPDPTPDPIITEICGQPVKQSQWDRVVALVGEQNAYQAIQMDRTMMGHF